MLRQLWPLLCGVWCCMARKGAAAAATASCVLLHTTLHQCLGISAGSALIGHFLCRLREKQQRRGGLRRAL